MLYHNNSGLSTKKSIFYTNLYFFNSLAKVTVNDQAVTEYRNTVKA